MLDSSSRGEPTCFLDAHGLEQGLQQRTASPRDRGRLTRIVRRDPQGVRCLLDSTELTVAEGVPGDQWERDPDRDPDAQLAVMEEGVAQLICNRQPPELSGDNLWLDLDLSRENLPTGSRLQIAESILEVTPLPHDGCREFQERFGPEALRFVSQPVRRHLNLPGIYLRVIVPGQVRTGDEIVVIRRSPIR